MNKEKWQKVVFSVSDRDAWERWGKAIQVLEK